MSEFEKYIANKNSVWGKRRNNQGRRQLKPTEIAEMLNELERVKQERDVATKSAERLAANCELLESQRNLAESERRVLQYKLADANEGRAQAESECDAAQQSRARLVELVRAKNIETDVMASDIRNIEAQLSAVVIANAKENDQLRADLVVLTEERNLLLSAAQGQMERDAAKQRADELQKAFDALHKMHEGAFADARSLANFIDYHCVEDLPDVLTREIVKKYIDPAQPALPLAFSECPECSMTHAPGENTLCSQ